jgi:hypothetical protein
MYSMKTWYGRWWLGFTFSAVNISLKTGNLIHQIKRKPRTLLTAYTAIIHSDAKALYICYGKIYLRGLKIQIFLSHISNYLLTKTKQN